MDAQTKSAAGVPAAIADKIENETPQAHQETDKLTAAAISADEYRLTPASTGDILASRELSFEQEANDTPSDRVEPEADHHALTKVI